MARMLRQGDVLLVEVDPERAAQLRARAAKIERVQEIVLAEGETTGHAHRLSGRIDRFGVGDRMFVTVEEDDDGPGWLTHEEHRDFPVPAATYEVRLQREFTEVEDRASWTRVVD